jgi:hypothetical protein
MCGQPDAIGRQNLFEHGLSYKDLIFDQYRRRPLVIRSDYDFLCCEGPVLSHREVALQINLIYDSSAATAPAAFKTAMAAAATFLDDLILNPITVNIQVGWGEDDNGKYSIGSNYSLGGALDFLSVGYSALRNALVSNATTPMDQLAVASLPTSDP